MLKINFKLHELIKIVCLWATRGLIVLIGLAVVSLFAYMFFLGGQYGIAAFSIVLILVVYIIKNIDGVKVIVSWVLALWDYQSRLAVKYQIEGHVNRQIRSLKDECEELCPASEIRIEWTKTPETAQSFIKNGKPIVRIGYHNNSNTNLSKIMYSFVKDVVCFNVKPFIDEDIFDTTTLALSKGLLDKINEETGRYFVNTIVHPSLTSEEIEELYHDICTLYENGFLTPIALNEFNKTTKEYERDIAPRWLKQESKDVIIFLRKLLYSKEQFVALTGEEGSYILKKRYYKIALIKVSDPETYARGGLRPHKGAVEHAIKQGVENIYICGRGEKNNKLAKQLTNSYYDDKRIKNVMVREFKQSEHRPAVVGVIQIKDMK